MTDRDQFIATLELCGVVFQRISHPSGSVTVCNEHAKGPPFHVSFTRGGALHSGWGLWPSWRYDAASAFYEHAGVTVALAMDAEPAPRGME